MGEVQAPDLDALALRIVARLDTLRARSDEDGEELAALVASVRAAVEADDAGAQWALLGEVRTWLDENAEIREELRNVFQMFYFYVHAKSEGESTG